MSFGRIARGLNDVKLYPLIAADAFGTGVDAPGARTLSYSTASDTDPWEGDDTIIANVANAPVGSGSLATGALSLAALAVVLGGTASTTGTTPNQVTTLEQSGAASLRYFGATGQAKAADGGAYRVTIHKAIATDVSEELAVNAWNEPTISFEFIPNTADKFITRAQYETLAALT